MTPATRLTRRRLVDLLLAGQLASLALLIAHPIIAFLWPGASEEADPEQVRVGTLAELAAGSSRIVRFGRRPVLVIRDRAGRLSAFSASCTHLKCTVQFRDDLKMIWCACHDGRYDLTGRNVAGPPPRPLDPYRVEVRGGDVFVRKA